MTTTTEASEALARLREVVKPGGTVTVVTKGYTRTGIRKVLLRPPHGNLIVTFTYLVADALGARIVPNTCFIGLRPGDRPDALLDRLSVALFGEPGQIRGEYL